MESTFTFSNPIIGTMRWGKWGKMLTPSKMTQFIEKCVDRGFSTFDSAPIYGGYTTEKQIGVALQNSSISRSDIQLITKCGIQYPCENSSFRIKHYDHSAKAIRDSVDQSLRDLQTDFIDLLLIHRPGYLMDFEEMAKVFEELYSRGKVRYFGLSNFPPSQVKQLNNLYPITTNQIEFSLTHLNPLLEYHFHDLYRMNVRPTVWSPLGSLFAPNSTELRQILQPIASTKQSTLEGVLSAFIAKIPGHPIPIIGSTRIEKIEAFSPRKMPTLSTEEWYYILEKASGKCVD